MSEVATLPSAAIDHAQPMSQQVYEYLRVRIVDNRLPPGAKISESALSQRLKISRTPLRAALQKLATEGLVHIRPQVGTIVASLNDAELLEAISLRAALETEVVRTLAETGADLTTLDPILAVQKHAAEQDDYATFFGRDEAFHAELARIAGLPRAWKLAMSIKGHVDRQRYILMSGIPKRSQRAFEEHLRIIDEIRAGNAEGAASAMRDHVNSVMEQRAPDQKTTRN